MPPDPAQAVVDRLAHLLHRSVVLDDPAVRLLCSSAHFGDEDDVRVHAVLQRDAGPQAIGHVLAQGVAHWTRSGVIPAEPAIGMRARVCVPVRGDGRLLGLLMVIDAEGTLTPAELAHVEGGAAELADLLDERSRDEPDALLPQHVVADLVGAEPSLRRQALAQAADRGVLDRFPVVTAVALGVVPAGTGSPADRQRDTGHQDAALGRALGTGRPAAATGELHTVAAGTALLLLGSSGPLGAGELRGHAERMVRRVRELSAGRFGCVAGIGGTAPGLEAAERSARQARVAAQGAAAGLAPPVAEWAALGPYGPLLLLPDAAGDRGMLPEPLQRLLAVDRNGQLVETLRAYLDCAGAGPAAAEVLHVHRTTLYYRLGRIAELTGLDLADGRTRLTLHLGLSVLDVVEARRSRADPLLPVLPPDR